MIVNITYPSKQITKEIDDVVGVSYTFFERIRMGGIGTAKLQIVEATEEIHKLLSNSLETKYCHLECRRKGLIVGFRSVMKIFVWLIPYHQLSKLNAPFNGQINKKFIRKVLALKAEYLEKFNFRL